MAYYRSAFPLHRIPAEMRSVLACLSFSHLNEPDRLLDTCRQINDWPAFLRWVRRHRVLPLIYKNLHSCAWDIVPDTVRRVLEQEYRRNSLKCLALAGETVRLIRDLAKNGIAAMPIKGSALARQVYDNLESRHAGDIDLLIAPEDTDKADAVLQMKGYCLDNPDIMRTPLRRRVIAQKVHHYHYFSATNRIATELHWKLSPIFRLPLHFDRIWSQGEPVSLAGDELRVLPADINMIFLCIHGATHGWARLKWLCDIAHIQAGYHEVDWKRLLETSHELDALRPFVQATVLSHILFETPLPDSVIRKAAQDSMIPALVKAAIWRIDDREPLPTTVAAKCAFHLYTAGLRNSTRYKIDVLNLTYNADDWSAISLPDRLFFLYYPLRPLLWVVRQIRRKRFTGFPEGIG